MDQQNTNQQIPEALPTAPKKPFYKKIWFAISAGLLGVVLLLWFTMYIFSLFSGSSSAPTMSAANIFYDMVETAGQKTKVHFFYETKREARGKDGSVYVRSLAEFDVKSKEYSLVFVSDALFVNAGRCVKGKEYSSALDDPNSLSEAEAAITSAWAPVKTPIGTCNYSRIKHQGSFTDGILPVGITEAQAKEMVAGLKQRDPMTFEDEGLVTFRGKKAHKISFEVSKQKNGKKNNDASVFFFALRDGTSSKVGANLGDLETIRSHFENRFHQTSPTPELKGYYLIDKDTKLPLYSEMNSIGDNIAPAVTTNIYAFPEALTLNESSPLPSVDKR